MRKKLSAAYLLTLANSERDSRDTIFDTASDAVLRVGPRGMTWCIVYRVRGEARQRWHAFGAYPATSLQEARLEASRLKERAAQGVDPVEEVRVQEAAEAEAAAAQQRAEQLRKASSFSITVEDYLAANAHRDKDGLANTKRNLKHASDAFGSVPLNEITKAIVMQLVNKRSANGKYAANATFDDVRALLNWAVGQGRIDHSPMAGLKKPHRTKPRDVYLTPDELKAVWIAALDEPYPFGPWIRMIIATGGQRRQDVSRMRRKDIGPLVLQERDPATNKLVPIKFDHVWRDTDPSKPQKKQRVHEVPLNKLAQSILKEVPHFLHGEYVFSGTGGDRPISGYSKANARLRKAAGVEKEWSVHTLRHSFATLAAEHCGALPDEVAMVQNRVSGFLRGAERVYQHSSFIRRKQRLLDDWGAFVQALVAPKKKEAARRG